MTRPPNAVVVDQHLEIRRREHDLAFPDCAKATFHLVRQEFLFPQFDHPREALQRMTS
jgi:hypothetical protein